MEVTIYKAMAGIMALILTAEEHRLGLIDTEEYKEYLSGIREKIDEFKNLE